MMIKNRAGAEAAFLHFLDTYTYGYATGDPTPLQAAITSECEFCRGVARDIQGMWGSGQSVRGGRITVLSTTAHATDSDEDAYLLSVVVRQDAQEAMDATGRVKASYPADPERVFEALSVWDGERWRIDKAAVNKDGQ